MNGLYLGKKSILTFISLLLIFYAYSVKAERVLPVFSGQWYGAYDIKYIATDSCISRNVFEAGIDQKKYHPTYTLEWDWHPGSDVKTAFANWRHITLGNLDRITEQYTKNASIPRQQRIHFLWQLAKKYQENKFKFNYIMGCLGYLKPIELVPAFIKSFYLQTKVYNQLLIISTISDALSVPEKSLKSHEKTVATTRIFLETILTKSNNPRILNGAIYAYQRLVPNVDTLSALKKLEKRQGIHFMGTKNAIFPFMKRYYFFRLFIAFSDKNIQKKQIPKLIARYGNNKQFASAICSLLVDFPTQRITNSMRLTLIDYLKAHKKELTAYLNYPGLTNCLWLEAYSNLMTTNDKTKIDFIKNYLAQLPNPFIQSQVLFNLKGKTLAKLPKSFLAKLESTFQQKLFTNTSMQNKQKLMLGISAINSFLKH